MQPHHARCKCSALQVREQPQRSLNGKLCERPENYAYAGQCGLSAGSCILRVRCLQGNDNCSSCPTVVRLLLECSHLGRLHCFANHRGSFPTQLSIDTSCEDRHLWYFRYHFSCAKLLPLLGQECVVLAVTCCDVYLLHPAASLSGSLLFFGHGKPT